MHIFCILDKEQSKEKQMIRTTITLDQKILDALLEATKAKSKASAVREAIGEYLKKDKTEKIKSMRGKLEFDLTADEIRHDER
jgi:metal-responsive CopG/Arc/MetJ family transcriptional regulator